MRKVVLSAAAALALSCAACSDNEIYPVSGKVMYKGVPAAGAIVSFHRRGSASIKDLPIFGAVQNDGSFTVICGPLGKGAPPGDYDVLIEWTRYERPERKCCRVQTGPDKLKGRYADPKHPRLHATVAAPATNLPPFELANDGKPPRRKALRVKEYR